MKQGGQLGTLKDIGVLFAVAIGAYAVFAAVSLVASRWLSYGFWDILWRVSGFCGVTVILAGGVSGDGKAHDILGEALSGCDSCGGTCAGGNAADSGCQHRPRYAGVKVL